MKQTFSYPVQFFPKAMPAARWRGFCLLLAALFLHTSALWSASLTVTGTTVGGPTWNRPVANGGNAPVPPASSVGTAVRYATVHIQVDVSGSYSFQCTATAPLGWDNYAFLYQNCFDPAAPFSNVLVGNDDNPSVGFSGFSRNLTAGVSYVLVVTGFNNTDAGAWSTLINGPGNITELPSVLCPPAFSSCPGATTANTAAGQCNATVSYTATATGSPTPTLSYVFSGATTGSGSGTGTGSTFQKGVTNVVVTVTNVNGSTDCAFTVTVNDNQNPSITCPTNISRNTDAGQCTAVVTYTPTFSDNCPGATLSVVTGPPSGSAFPKGSTPITLRVTDAAGRTAECGFSVIVTDTQLPNITCPANIARNTDANLCTAVVNFTTPTATDNCSPVPSVMQTAGPASGSAFPTGTTQVKFKATDGAGLMKECTFSVTVNDAQLPSIACPSNIVTNTAAGLCQANVNYATPTASDNCALAAGSPSLQSGPASGGVFPKGQTIVVWRATDLSGLTKTCTFRVTVNDTEAPVITCPTVAPVNTAPNTCAANVTYTTPTATDNCPGTITVIRSGGPASGSSFSVGSTTVTWRAIDAAGRSSTCSFAVTVVDNQAPSITCPGNIAASGSGSPCTANVAYATPTAADNCPGTLTPFLVSGLTSGSAFPSGATLNTWRVIAPNGQSSDCSFSVTVGCGNAPDGGSNEGQVATRTSQREPGVVEIFPNPSNGTFNLNLQGFQQQVIATVFDATGRQVWQKQMEREQTQVTVDMSDARFSAGLYMVTVASDGTVLTKRLVLQR